MSRTLVIRLSALGDVAMLIPVLYAVAKKYPEDEFLLMTKKPLLPIFKCCPYNVKVLGVDSDARHGGLRGLKRLILEIESQSIDRIADVHDVLRSKAIRSYFQLKGKKVAVIDKGRNEKKVLTRKRDKILSQLQTSVERYRDVFLNLGYDFFVDFKTIFDYGERDFNLIEPVTGEKNCKWIGIAPFAKHEGKIYPSGKMQEVIDLLSQRSDCSIFLFGGKTDQSRLEAFIKKHTNVHAIAGKLAFSSELILMSYLDVMVSMDSGNMHLASLTATPVVSIWGATHPYLGFYGYGQAAEYAVQTDLFCRPCSVYGNKPCYRKNYECLYSINPRQIVDRVNKILK